MARQKFKKLSPESFDSAPSHLPSSQDKIWAQQILEELEDRSNSLSQRLTRARQQQVKTMSKALETTKQRMANIRHFLAPIRSLPEELVSFILQIAWGNGHSPWTLAHVSRCFRTATFNSPLMWNNILFRATPSMIRNVGGVERCHTGPQLAAALQRSKKALITLTIELKLPNGGDPAIEAVYKSMPGVLNTAADRLHSLTILDQGFDYQLPNLVTKGLKNLHTLYVSGPSKSRRYLEPLLALVDKTSPNLQDMTLLISPALITPGRECWQRLTTLVLHGIPKLALMSQCLNLRSFHLHCHLGPREATEPLPVPPITLPNLEHFVTHFFPVTFFRSLFLPALVTLEIESNQHVNVTEPFPPFPSLVALLLKGRFSIDPSCFIAPSLTSLSIRSTHIAGCVITTPRHYKDCTTPSILTKLVLENVTDMTDTALTMLRHHAQISSLNITPVSSTPSIIRSLWSTALHSSAADDNCKALCPSLKNLRVKFRSPRYKQVAILGMLQAMAMVRESRGIPLESISFLRFRHGSPALKELLPLTDEGQEADSDSDQSTCDACNGYHG
ncbi:hypothetical protein M408DRAFT_28395 [Serendipita vermifera MAFF 305830]|uniref:F-box domain-containing protein n=1 Tax=Serendipita vermifera MAFF 305830 TaxID=933852 RepID=A0A0C3AU98_SERVB|nr:hypothetical protein M408DRAFT_28395 [Serendipita vermifera MAFF 305830]